VIFVTLFDRVRWMTSQEFASFLYDVQLRAVRYDRAAGLDVRACSAFVVASGCVFALVLISIALGAILAANRAIFVFCFLLFCALCGRISRLEILRLRSFI